MRVLLIRHGETHGYFDDVGLTEHGEAQARAKGKELAADLPAGTPVRLPHAPTARATATAVTLRAVLAEESGGLHLGALEPDGRFDSLQFLYEGEARESSGVAAYRLRQREEGGGTPDWALADRFDTDHGAGSRLGGPIDRWMASVNLHFEPPQVIAYRAWAGVRALAAEAPPGGVALVSSHSALLRGFAAAAIGADPGEPVNLEHVEVVIGGASATVTFREHRVDVEVPATVPPWLRPDYLSGARDGAELR